MLRTVYPTLVDDYDVRVRSYLEVLAERGLPAQTKLSGKVVLHDSCVYARYENVVERAARRCSPRRASQSSSRPMRGS